MSKEPEGTAMTAAEAVDVIWKHVEQMNGIGGPELEKYAAIYAKAKARIGLAFAVQAEVEGALAYINGPLGIVLAYSENAQFLAAALEEMLTRARAATSPGVAAEESP